MWQLLILSRESLYITFDKSFGENFVKMIKFSLEVIIKESLASRVRI